MKAISKHKQFFESYAKKPLEKRERMFDNPLYFQRYHQPVTIVSPLLNDGGWFPASKHQGGGPAAAPVTCNMDNKIQSPALANAKKQEVKLHAMP
jgi:hypothetical protein